MLVRIIRSNWLPEVRESKYTQKHRIRTEEFVGIQFAPFLALVSCQPNLLERKPYDMFNISPTSRCRCNTEIRVLHPKKVASPSPRKWDGEIHQRL